MPKPLYLSFMTEVKPVTAQALMGVVGQHIQQGYDELHLLLTTPGGNVREGVALYNLLRALPIKLTTYNTGSVNSIGNVLYLAGEKRYAAPASSFMFHGVGFDISQQVRFEEKNLLERLEGLKNDQQLIADIIVQRTNISADDVKELFLKAAFIRADEAKGRGIVHDILEIKVPQGATFIQLVFQS